MPEVVLNVSKLVKRIFEARFGPGVAKIDRQDIIYHYLQGDPLVANAHRYRHLQTVLTETVTLRVSNLLAKRLRSQKRQLYVGHYLHKIYQDQVLIFVHAQVEIGIPAQTAMRTWLEMNGVQEDDYGLDSAYTSWKRWKKLKTKLSPKKSFSNSVESDLLNVKKREGEVQVPFDYRDVIKEVNLFFKVGYCNLLKQNITITHDGRRFTYEHSNDTSCEQLYPRKVLCYILSEYCWMSTREIAKLVKVSQRNICNYIQYVKFDIVQYPGIKRSIDTILAACPYHCCTKKPEAVLLP